MMISNASTMRLKKKNVQSSTLAIKQTVWCGTADLERLFAFRWMERNEQWPDTLASLLETSPDECQALTQRDARVAATIIQWLGTNCGFHFVVETLRRAGYIIADPPRANLKSR
jgi:hypothetical protein